MTNPFLKPWETPYGLPPFSDIQPMHFADAFAAGFAAHLRELDAIATQSEAPSFDNTVVAFDRSGELLDQVSSTFFNLTSAATSEALQTVQRDVAPKLAAHNSAVYMNAALFARIEALYQRRETLALNVEQMRLLERIHLDFVRAGARLQGAAMARYREIMQQLAQLTTQFQQNVLADENQWMLALNGEADLAGLPAQLRDAAAAAAEARGIKGGHVITLSRSLAMPFLSYSERRDLRKQVYNAWSARGEHDGPSDNRRIAVEILTLRKEQAALHGFSSYADYALVDRMAKKPAAVAQLLERVWTPAKARAADELAALNAMRLSFGQSEPVARHDWHFYAEKIRKARYDLDDSETKPYFELNAMLSAAFDCAGKLFGLSFVEREGVALYHPDVRTFEVRDAAGQLSGIFLSDNFARQGKSGGAWMSAYREQSRGAGDQNIIPIIANHNNFAKAPAGQQTLLGLDDVRTLFHEFGHGLHGLLSNVHFKRLSGINVLSDYVELPSQLFEHWAFHPDVLRQFARHYQTGEAIPQSLMDRIARAEHFNAGFQTVEYTSSALVDMALHSQPSYDNFDLVAFEQAELARLGAPKEIPPRHRVPHFSHVFTGEGYAAGYYVYLWAEVLDADAFDAFVEAGNPFDAATAARLKQFVYAAGNSIEPQTGYVAFRGREASVEPMLRGRGLLAATEAS
ncbi:MAG: M3 family peptidase [Betaproteobacteria bacterium]|nr:MAG: M3 family peptidase [Betaproteobacteria bacterium]